MTGEVECEECEGNGFLTERHFLWGRRDCPEDIREVECADCGGRGFQ